MTEEPNYPKMIYRLIVLLLAFVVVVFAALNIGDVAEAVRGRPAHRGR